MEDQTPSKSRTRTSTPHVPKVKQDLFSPRTQRLALFGKEVVRERIALVDAFPTHKEEFLANCLKIA